ncbi:MAG: VOC family protein [Solirubrobacteraceae bacterium]
MSAARRTRVVGVNHVALEVDSVDAALAWWARYFDFELRGRRGRMAWIDLGDQFLALAEPRSQPPDGGRHFGLVVDDKEALRAALREAGEDVAAAGSLRVRDPSGNTIEIVDYRDVQFTKAPEVLHGMGLEGLHKRQGAIEELRAKGLAGG